MTLPPPEWSPPKPGVKREGAPAAPPGAVGLPRRTGLKAEEAVLRGRLAAARVAGSPSLERAESASFARWLAARDRDLDEAVELATYALSMGEGDELRRELSSWFESMGLPEKAAEALRSVAEAPDGDGQDAAQVLTRMGGLWARAGRRERADGAFALAMERAPDDAMAAELRGAVAASGLATADSATRKTLVGRVVDSFLAAARCRGQSGSADAEMEDALRAFNADPASERAAAALAQVLLARGRGTLVDEVERRHAVAVGGHSKAHAAALHSARRFEAVAAGEYLRAFAAALDEGLDGAAPSEAGAAFDEILQRVGLVEALAARLEVRAETSTGDEAARLFESLGRARAGLEDGAGAQQAFVRALGAHPGHEDALTALRVYAADTGDPLYLVEALVRAILSSGEEPSSSLAAARVARGRDLAALAETHLHDVSLTAWAQKQILEGAPDDADATAWLASHGAEVAKAQEALADARRKVSEAPKDDRVERLWSLAAALRGDPGAAEEYGRVLRELAVEDGVDPTWRRLAFDVAWRRGDLGEVARLAMELLASGDPAPPATVYEARRQLAAVARARGHAAGAADEARAMLSEMPDSRAAASLAWITAACAGDAQGRGAALAHLAPSCSGPLRALLASVASATFGALGHREEARRLGELASSSDPSSPRALSQHADAVVGHEDRSAAVALERAINATIPRADWCRALAQTLETLGDAGHAVGWTQRLVALLPGDGEAVETYIRRVMRGKDASRLADALAWVMTQPLALSSLASLLAEALVVLVNLDPERSIVVARRAVDVYGPRDATLRAAALEVAQRAGDPAFAASVLERLLSASLGEEDPRSLLTRLVSLRLETGDGDGAARTLLRAARAGVPYGELANHLETLSVLPLTGDGELARLEARALFAAGGQDAGRTALAYRHLGAARWDLLADGDATMDAWVKAADVAPTLGYATLGTDLIRFAEPRAALATLSKRMAEETDPRRSGALASEAARVALLLGEPSRAMDLAGIALQRNPGCSSALASAEAGAVATVREQEMVPLYESVAAYALGRFGRRAAHYRAARFFEGRGLSGLALRHAAQAFSAVPSEGSIFALMARTASQAGDPALALRAVEQVAEGAQNPLVRAAWLQRAAGLAGDGEDGARRRVDILLRAALASPDAGSLGRLEAAVRDLLRRVPEESDALELRLSRAASTLCSRIEGPDGARTALILAEMLLSLFEFTDTPAQVLGKAFHADADIDEYARIVPYGSRLAKGGEGKAFLQNAIAASEQPYANVGVAALRLLAAIASHVPDKVALAKALVGAAEKDPDDDGLVREADLAARRLGDPAVLARLAKKVTTRRRVEAWSNLAREKLADGAYGEAIEALERASVLAEGDGRRAVEAELRAAYEASGRGTELEARALRDALNTALAPDVRAAYWTDLAERREVRRDLRGAVAALQEAARLDPTPLERWSALERVADVAGNVEVRLAAIEALAERAPPEAKVDVHKRLARVLEGKGDTEGALRTWQRVLDLDVDDEDADQALEASIVARGQWAELAEHLARRAERLAGQSGPREKLRALRLRRTAILEQRLGRVQEACDELALLLSEWPESPSALRYLADLHERTGEPAKAAPLWRRVASLEADPTAQVDLELRAARAESAAGNLPMALTHVKAVLVKHPGQRDATDLRLAFARAANDDKELGDALDDAAMRPTESPSSRSTLLMEASQAAAQAGDSFKALERVQRAAASSPDHPPTQLAARSLEYRLRGVGAPAEAKKTLEELANVRPGLSGDDDALCTFLMAEAMDAVNGGGAGLRELTTRRDTVGPHPLVALGMAERLYSQGSYGSAIGLFEEALRGNLLGLRRRSAVALCAADAAVRKEQHAAARFFLDIAAEDPDARPTASRRAARLQTQMDDAVASAKAEKAQEATAAVVADLETRAKTAANAADRNSARLELARLQRGRGEEKASEDTLWAALADGSLEAGTELSTALEATPERSGDRVRVRRRMTEIAPGDTTLLEALRLATLADGNLPHGRALEHLQHAFDTSGGAAVAPPPISAQREQPGVLSILMRPTREAAALEALGIVWEGAGSLFFKDPASYGIANLEKVTPAAPVTAPGAVPARVSAAGRLYEAAVRLLDVPRIPLYLRRTAEPLRHEVALLSPTSVILTGDLAEETPDLAYAVGVALASALAPHVLVLGLPEAEAQGAWRAVLAAFGPPEMGRGLDVASARLAESFWHLVPNTRQRRLQELLAGAPADFEVVRARALQSVRRVGLFLAGDVEAAAFALLRSHPEVDPTRLRAPGGLKAVAAEVPALADLLLLAGSLEYADARWHVPIPAPPRSRPSGALPTS